MGLEIQEKHYLTQVEGEEPTVRIFGLIPDGYDGELSELTSDDDVYYWLDRQEWENLKTGQVYGDAVILEGDEEVCLMCNEIKDNNGLVICSECNKPERTINDIKRELEEGKEE